MKKKLSLYASALFVSSFLSSPLIASPLSLPLPPATAVAKYDTHQHPSVRLSSFCSDRGVSLVYHLKQMNKNSVVIAMTNSNQSKIDEQIQKIVRSLQPITHNDTLSARASMEIYQVLQRYLNQQSTYPLGSLNTQLTYGSVSDIEIFCQDSLQSKYSDTFESYHDVYPVIHSQKLKHSN